MTKTELIYVVARESGLPERDVKRVMQTLTEIIFRELRLGNRVHTDMGTFLVTEYGAKMGRNPRTGELIQLSAHKYPQFKPSPSLKREVN